MYSAIYSLLDGNKISEKKQMILPWNLALFSIYNAVI